MKLMTIGYEGLNTQQFFDLLISSRVQMLIDLRELPLSRKPGFSKSALAFTSTKYGLKYLHFAALGCPRDIRHAYREDDNWSRYSRRFINYLNTQEVAIQELAEYVQRQRCCLLCFEADNNFCHRSLVAQRLVKVSDSSLVLTHLQAPSLERVGMSSRVTI